MQPDNPHADETLARIVAAGTERFTRYGYHGVSMRELAEAVGLSKPGLYHHVACKEDLLLAVLEAGLAALQPGIERLADRTLPWSARLERWIAEILSLSPDQASVMRIGREIVHIDPERREAFAATYRERFIGPLRAFLLEGEESGQLSHERANIGLWALLGMLTAFLEGEGGSRALGLDIGTLSRSLADILLHGLADRC